MQVAEPQFVSIPRTRRLTLSASTSNQRFNADIDRYMEPMSRAEDL